MLVRHGLSLSMGRNATIRRAVNAIEDIVSEHSEDRYAQPQVIPIPDEMEPSLPRVIFTSKQGHTQILVSQIGVTFNANYSDDWACDATKCKEYLLSKVAMIFAVARLGWSDTLPTFTGVTTHFRRKCANRAEAIEAISRHFVDGEMLRAQANEASYRWSLDVGDRHYSNVSVSTATELDLTYASIIDTTPRFNDKTIKSYAVEVVADYNDRLAYNNDVPHSSDEENAKQMIELGFEEASRVVYAFETEVKS